MNQPKVSIIIVNWNGLKDTIECLESLKKITYPNYKVVVVDNGSDGDDANVLEKRFGDYIHLIKNDRNYGGSGGYNIGVKYVLSNSDAEYLLILDNDTIVASDFLSKMVEAVGSDLTIGIISAMVCYYDEPDRFTFGWEKTDLWELDIVLTLGLITRVIGQKIFGRKTICRGQSDTIKEVEHVGFWCVLLRRRSVESIGFFAKEYRGFETVDYSIRARKAGYKIIQVPSAKVWHKFRSSNRIDGDFQYYGCSGLFRFMRKHAIPWQYRCFLLQFFVVHFWLAVAYYLIWHRQPRALLGFCKGIRDGLSEGKCRQ